MSNDNVCTAIRWSLIAGLFILGYSVNPVYAQYDWSERPEVHPGMNQAVKNAQLGRSGQHRAPLQKNLSLLGFLDLTDGVRDVWNISDVWAHGDFAYVGGFLGFPGADNPFVSVVDISDPANPLLVTRLPSIHPQFASPQDVKAARINTRYFQGDLLVVGNDGPLGGIQLWDVTDPTNPVALSTLTRPHLAWVHNVYLFQKGNRAFVLVAVPLDEVFPDTIGKDFAVVEITDPTQPEIVGSWTAGTDGDLSYGYGPNPFGIPVTCDPSICRGVAPVALCHDVWANNEGTVAYLSYWDLGLVLLDISDPTNPTFLGKGDAPPTFGGDEGDLHTAVPAQGNNLVITGDETVAPAPLWGIMRVFDTSDETSPFQIGAYATPGSLGDPLQDPFLMFRTMHNVIARGSRAYISWYLEGIRVVDISQPSNPREIAAFVPDAVQTGPGFFWGIYEHQDLILGSDGFSGLFILKQEASSQVLEVNRLSLGEITFSGDLPAEFMLEENYPNPFNPTTRIRFQVPENSPVSIKVVNMLGREVRTLAEGMHEAGTYAVEWDGRDNEGNAVASGIYLYRLEASRFTQTRMMTLLK